MTQETRNVLYNKQAHELNKDEVDYIYSLLRKKRAKFNFWFISIMAPFMGLIVPLALAYPLATSFIQYLPVTTILGASTGLLLGGMIYTMEPSLKSLGLTRKEWKELKKSRRLKDLDKLVKLYEQSNKSYLDDLVEREVEIKEEISENETKKTNLLSELELIKEREKENTGEEQTSKYTQEYVAELLKSEENLLMRRLNQLKQEQEMLQENADNKTITESGKRAEQSIDYMKQALKNCQEFNEEFKGETFDN